VQTFKSARSVLTSRSARGVLTFGFAVCGRPGGLHDISLAGVRERRLDEGIGRARSNTGPDNRQEIVSEIRE
jgi:hypothetical protein